MDSKRAMLQAIAVAAAALSSWTSLAQAVNTPETPPDTTEDALHAMADAAGIIFAGTATAVRRPQMPDGSAGNVVEIDFAISESVRGVSGSTYTLREWAGLWTANDQPLRVGQRYLMLLHAPNAAGLSSPVAGTDGAIPIRGVGPVATPNGVDTPSSGPATLAGAASLGASNPGTLPTDVVDLGWIATHVNVPLAYASPHGVSGGPISVHASTRASSSVAQPGTAASGLPAGIPADARARSYTAVLQTLQTWETSHAARR